MNRQASRPDFYAICQARPFSPDQLADLADTAGVERRVVNAMWLDNPVKRSEAIVVLEALSRITGETYTLTTVSVTLFSEEEK